MKNLFKTLTVGAVLTGALLVGTTTSHASTNYNLTAINSVGKKVNVYAPKGTALTKINSKWYKGSIKYVTYKKVGTKWVKQNKSATAYIPSSKVASTSTTTWNKVTKQTYEYDGSETGSNYYKVDDEISSSVIERATRYLNDTTGTMTSKSVYATIPAGEIIYHENSKGIIVPIQTHDSKGNVIYVTTQKEFDTESYDVDYDYDEHGNDIYDENGDYDHTEWTYDNFRVTSKYVEDYNNNLTYTDYNKKVTTTYKTNSSTQAYTKTY
ncbi:hypothetical protein [Gottfriedia luciferensis]|uniref:hypothetical protein n=1 Tax=Gottfriedia luciferensis TaxID=178774 RepID=UPI000B43ABBF|nr:hypothetical protein [Gottfriedia luciferensis]